MPRVGCGLLAEEEARPRREGNESTGGNATREPRRVQGPSILREEANRVREGRDPRILQVVAAIVVFIIVLVILVNLLS